MIYLQLFLGFLKVGCFSFGGAYAAIPLIRETVLSYGWIDDAVLSNMIAVSESTPGPVMVNMATYVGASQGGVLGAAIATFATVLPAFVIIILLMALLKNVLKNRYVQALLDGMKPCMIGIILAMGLYMIGENVADAVKAAPLDYRALIITVLLGCIWYFGPKVTKKKLNPIVLIGISAVLGMGLYAI